MTSFLRWVPNRYGGELAAEFPFLPSHDPPLEPRDEAAFLLQLAAEVEHALLVQYLFGTYTIRFEGFAGPHVPANPDVIADGWRQAIRLIALQEMGHLMTVQNLLLFIGSPVRFERPAWPHRSHFYPFDLELEGLSKDALAKYVAAEMPAVTPDPLLREIIFRARGATGGQFVNRVGALYAAIGLLFGADGPITDRDCDFESVAHQADPSHWRLPDGFILMVIRTRDEARAAVRAIAAQGEGPGSQAAADPTSHYARFRRIYSDPEAPETSFPESNPVIAPVEWSATLPVLRNPCVGGPDMEARPGRNVVRDPFARGWCRLFNTRYRILLTCLPHYLSETGNSPDRQQLVQAATYEMRTAMTRVAKELVGMPAGRGGLNAGPPFEIDYDLTVPAAGRNRWRILREVVLSSKTVIRELRRFTLSEPQVRFLDGLDRHDDDFLISIGQHTGC